MFLAGYVPTENMRFREESLSFKVTDAFEEEASKTAHVAQYTYPQMTKTFDGAFQLTIERGSFGESEVRHRPTRLIGGIGL